MGRGLGDSVIFSILDDPATGGRNRQRGDLYDYAGDSGRALTFDQKRADNKDTGGIFLVGGTFCDSLLFKVPAAVEFFGIIFFWFFPEDSGWQAVAAFSRFCLTDSY